MNRSLLALAVVLGTATTSLGSGQSRWTLEFDRLGPVKVGMTVPEAVRALKAKLHAVGEFDPGDCHYVANDRAAPGVRFMVETGDRITRIDVTTKEVATGDMTRSCGSA